MTKQANEPGDAGGNLAGKHVVLGLSGGIACYKAADSVSKSFVSRREADAILVAPCGADFMATLLHGRADDLLSLMRLARW